MNTYTDNKYILFLLTVVIIGSGILQTTPATAQRTSGMVGIGGQFGEPSGLSLKFYNNRSASIDFLAAWDFDEHVFLDGHAIFERHLGTRGTAHVFFGPGGFVEFRDRAGDQEDDVTGGISGKLGLGFLFNQFEIFGHISPRLALSPQTDGEMGGGLGFRVYF